MKLLTQYNSNSSEIEEGLKVLVYCESPKYLYIGESIGHQSFHAQIYYGTQKIYSGRRVVEYILSHYESPLKNDYIFILTDEEYYAFIAEIV